MKKLQAVLIIIVALSVLSACNETPHSQSDISSVVSKSEPSEAEAEVSSQTPQTKADSPQSSESASSNKNTFTYVPANTEKPSETEKTDEESKLTNSSPSASNSSGTDKDYLDEPVGINKYRVDYGIGTCRHLRENVSVILFFMDDFESSWTEDKISSFTNLEVKPGLAFLEKEAKRYGINLKFDIKQSYSSVFYDNEIIADTNGTGLVTIDVLDQAAHSLMFSSDEKMIEYFKSKYNTEVVCFTIFNKNGTSYAINPRRGVDLQVEEHCIVFAYDLNSDRNDPIGSQSSIVAHEMLHLSGAEDFYETSGRKALAQAYYPDDIMLGANYYINTNNIGDATAFYIGWTDKIPAVMYDENW